MPEKAKRPRRRPQQRRKGAVPRRRAKSPTAAQASLRKLRAELRAAKARIAELETHADTDVLVDALNRRGFERELRRAMAYAKRYGANAALVYLDVNGLKPVNDRHGHAAGDAVLRSVARTLVENVRLSDIVARLGGDEFAVLLWNLTERDAALKTAALEAAIAASRVAIGERSLAVTAAAGFTMLWPADDPQQIVERADQAMYARKRELKITR